MGGKRTVNGSFGAKRDRRKRYWYDGGKFRYELESEKRRRNNSGVARQRRVEEGGSHFEERVK